MRVIFERERETDRQTDRETQREREGVGAAERGQWRERPAERT